MNSFACILSIIFGMVIAILFDEKINFGWLICIVILTSYMIYDRNSSYLLIAGLFAIAGSITGFGRRFTDAMKEKDKKKDA